MMTPDNILGWATAILDTFNMRTVIQVILYISVAAAIYRVFRSRGD